MTAEWQKDALLAGVTVIEVPGGVATRYCGRLFAAQGARVIQLAEAGEAAIGYGGKASTAYAAWLDDRKERRDGDLASALRQIGADADLVIAGQDGDRVAAADAVLARAGGRALRLGLTWFAADGPYRRWSGSDALIQALSGVAYAFGPAEGPPRLPRGHAPQVVGGVTGFIAALAGLIGRASGWQGRRIDLDIFSANLCFSEGGVAALALSGERVRRRGVNRFTPTYPCCCYETADGWLGVTALTPAQWQALAQLVGLPELRADPGFATALQRLERAEEIDHLLAPRLRRRRTEEWLLEGQALRIPLAPVPTPAQLLDTPHWRERRAFAAMTDAAGASSFLAPALPYRVAAAAPRNGPREIRRRTVPAAGLPLEGLRVLDLSMGWAGPLATRHLADLGAEVVKVESSAYPDWWRGWENVPAADPPPHEIRPAFLMVNRNKLGITLDLRPEEGKALLRRLAARADVMVENYAPGVLDKLGVGAERLAAENPGLICLSMGAFGASGPWRGFRAYGSTVEQASGFPFVNGDADWPPALQHVAYGDAVAGLYGATAVLTALYRPPRERGIAIDLAQVECLFQLGADAIVAQSAAGAAPARSGSRHPLASLRTVVRGAQEDSWLAVSVETAAEWRALARHLGRDDLAAASDTLAARKAREDEMAAALAGWAATRAVAAAAEELQAAGVPAAPVLPAQALLRDPQLLASDFWRRAERRFIGSHIVPRAPYRLDGTSPPLNRPAPVLGEHNTEVLQGRLGLQAQEVQDLARRGIIGTERSVV